MMGCIHNFVQSMHQTGDLAFVNSMIRCSKCGAGFEHDYYRGADGVIRVGLRVFAGSPYAQVDPALIEAGKRERDSLIAQARQRGMNVTYGATTIGPHPGS